MKKQLIVILCLLLSGTAYGASSYDENIFDLFELERKSCANKTTQIQNIQGLLNKVDLWGYWEGSHEGEEGKGSFLKASGIFKAKVTFNGKSYGPYTVKICDHGNNTYTGSIFGYEAEIIVLGPKKIRVISPFDSNDSVVLYKIKNE